MKNFRNHINYENIKKHMCYVIEMLNKSLTSVRYSQKKK